MLQDFDYLIHRILTVLSIVLLKDEISYTRHKLFIILFHQT